VVQEKVKENEISCHVKRRCVGRRGILNETVQSDPGIAKNETRHWELKLKSSWTSL